MGRNGALDGFQDLVALEGFGKVVLGAEFDGFAGELNALVGS